jgi:hypothetical protein
MLVTFITFVCHLWLFQHNCDCEIHERTSPILKLKMLQPDLQSEFVGTVVYLFKTLVPIYRASWIFIAVKTSYLVRCIVVCLLRVSFGSGSLHIVAVLLPAGRKWGHFLWLAGWLHLHSSITRTHQVVSLNVAHVVNRRSFTVEDRLRSQASQCRICGRQIATGTGFSPSTPVSGITPRLHIHSSITSAA